MSRDLTPGAQNARPALEARAVFPLCGERRGSCVLVAALLLAAGCQDSENRAAKKRLFSAQEPAKVALAAAQPIDARALADRPEFALRVLTMGAREGFERLGPHRFKGTVRFEWRLGAEAVRLAEERTLDQVGPAAWSLKTTNDRDQGVEVIAVDGKTFVKDRYLKFRERARDRGFSDRLREDAFGALATAAKIFDGRLGLTADGGETVEGRAAVRYRFHLARAKLYELSAQAGQIPAVQFPSGGPDKPTQKRLDFASLRTPKSVEGTLLVDAQSGVPLRADLVARIASPGDEKGDAELTLRAHIEVALGAKVVVVPPKDFLPDEGRPQGVAAALERFEVERPDAGAKAAAKPSEPEDLTDE